MVTALYLLLISNKMTLGSLVTCIGLDALLLTLGVGYFKKHKSWLLTYLQNFCGALFVFSGLVKAVDPLGTAFKMEQYFAEFESTFADTWMSFIAPIFPWLSNYSAGFSVFMIVLEIVLGIMLILGSRSKLTSWLFLAIVGFFTFLTGFTYLTGYVPGDVNFFSFGQWGEYVETNMKVTDCGCFGDFLKLKPMVSFFKDLVLLVPAIYFVFKHKDMHQLFTKKVRGITIGASIVIFLVYCFSNFSWDLPHTDFRPFNVGKDVRATKQAEEDAAANVQVLGYNLTNKSSGEMVSLDYDTFLKEYKKYPKEEWEYEQLKSEPEMESTKISDFDFSDSDGNNMTEEILNDPNYHFMVVCYKFYYDNESTKEVVYQDTLYRVDTMEVDGNQVAVNTIDRIVPRNENEVKYNWNKDYLKPWPKVNAFLEKAEANGYNVYGLAGGASGAMIDDFRHETQAAYPFYEADDILLKTIVRSNPGIVLWKDGKIIMKWHHKQLPEYEKVDAEFLK